MLNPSNSVQLGLGYLNTENEDIIIWDCPCPPDLNKCSGLEGSGRSFLPGVVAIDTWKRTGITFFHSDLFGLVCLHPHTKESRILKRQSARPCWKETMDPVSTPPCPRAKRLKHLGREIPRVVIVATVTEPHTS